MILDSVNYFLGHPVYTKISTMININNFNISNPYVKIMFLVCSKGISKQVLSKFKLSLFAMNHWDKRNRYSFAVILSVTTSLLNMKRLVSSAYNLAVLKGRLNPLPISFTYIRKSSGPCGTQRATASGKEKIFCRRTYCCLLLK